MNFIFNTKHLFIIPGARPELHRSGEFAVAQSALAAFPGRVAPGRQPVPGGADRRPRRHARAENPHARRQPHQEHVHPHVPVPAVTRAPLAQLPAQSDCRGAGDLRRLTQFGGAHSHGQRAPPVYRPGRFQGPECRRRTLEFEEGKSKLYFISPD